VPSYRIYALTTDNHIKGVPEQIEFPSDQEVIAHAKAKLDGRDLEVWDGPRLVIRLSAKQRFFRLGRSVMITSEQCKIYLTECEMIRNSPETSIQRGTAIMGVHYALVALAQRLKHYDGVVQEENS
jgi:hypothetical protein